MSAINNLSTGLKLIAEGLTELADDLMSAMPVFSPVTSTEQPCKCTAAPVEIKPEPEPIKAPINTPIKEPINEPVKAPEPEPMPEPVKAVEPEPMPEPAPAVNYRAECKKMIATAVGKIGRDAALGMLGKYGAKRVGDPGINDSVQDKDLEALYDELKAVCA